jgi:hypothetical protein
MSIEVKSRPHIKVSIVLVYPKVNPPCKTYSGLVIQESSYLSLRYFRKIEDIVLHLRIVLILCLSYLSNKIGLHR